MPLRNPSRSARRGPTHHWRELKTTHHHHHQQGPPTSFLAVQERNHSLPVAAPHRPFKIQRLRSHAALSQGRTFPIPSIHLLIQKPTKTLAAAPPAPLPPRSSLPPSLPRLHHSSSVSGGPPRARGEDEREGRRPDSGAPAGGQRARQGGRVRRRRRVRRHEQPLQRRGWPPRHRLQPHPGHQGQGLGFRGRASCSPRFPHFLSMSDVRFGLVVIVGAIGREMLLRTLCCDELHSSLVSLRRFLSISWYIPVNLR